MHEGRASPGSYRGADQGEARQSGVAAMEEWWRSCMTEPEESESSGWELVLFHQVTKFKNDLETALLDAHSFQALRLRVRDIHSGLVATVKAFAKIFGGEKDHA